MDFTPSQIQTAKTLVAWLRKQGMETDKARMEVAKLLKRFEHRKIKQAMIQSSCTSLDKLKKYLLGKESFKNDKYG